MISDSHLQFHRQLINDLQRYIRQQPPFNVAQLQEEDTEFLTLMDSLSEPDNEEIQQSGQQVINTIVTRYPHITPMVPRDLFWFFGGDCLHFLGDEEIEVFQKLDEDYYVLLSQESATDYAKLRAGVIGWQPGQIN